MQAKQRKTLETLLKPIKFSIKQEIYIRVLHLCIAIVGFAMTEVEVILFIATYLCVALDMSRNGQQRGHWFYYHNRHCCIATLD
jgi:hypothetical protein